MDIKITINMDLWLDLTIVILTLIMINKSNK